MLLLSRARALSFPADTMSLTDALFPTSQTPFGGKTEGFFYASPLINGKNHHEFHRISATPLAVVCERPADRADRAIVCLFG
jgi:hypothetical protein